MKLTLGSVCSGVAGFDLAFERQGFEVKWQIEIDKNCRQLLKAKFPGAKIHNDLTQFKPKDTDAVSVICGGTPCQDLSVAGQREGLDGERSGLFFDLVRVCKKLRPGIVEWENVPGALSSNGGRDFARVVRAFTGLKVEVPEDGWGNAGFVRTPYPGSRWHIAWRVLDAQFFGLAQRRKRLFLIASLRATSGLEILFESESLCGNYPPSREAGERIAPTIASRVKGGGGLGTDLDGGLVSGAVSSKWSKGTGGPAGDECYNLVAHTLTREYDASEDGTGRGTPLVAIPIQEIGKRQSGTAQNGVGHGKAGDPMFSLQASAQHGVIAFDARQSDVIQYGPKSGPLDTCGSSIGVMAFQPRLARNGRGAPESISPALNGANAGATSDMRPCLMQGAMVRRLTPSECEILQGFPVGWTSGFSDSVRYRMLGNSVAVPVVEWLAKRINSCLENDHSI